MIVLEAKKDPANPKALKMYLNQKFYRKASSICFSKHLEEPKHFETMQQLNEWFDQIELRFARKKAYDFLADRNYPSSVLKEKLINLHLDKARVLTIIEECIQKKYCDDQSWVKQFIRYQLEKGYGPYAIRAKLQQKKLPSDLIAEELGKITIDEQREILRKISSALSTKKTPEQIIGYLQRRGFSLEVLYEIIKIQ